MVIPIMSENKRPTKKIVGDGKRITLRTNSDSLVVIGCGNTVIVENNEGSIKIVGDGCKLSVGKGNGTINYNGDGGYLETGRNLKVKYKGDGGQIVQVKEKHVFCCKDITDAGDKKKGSSTFVNNVSNCSFPTGSNRFIAFPAIRTPNSKVLVKKNTKS